MQLSGYTYLKVTNSRIVADSPFVYFIRAYIDSTYMATTTLNGEIFTANSASLFLKVSNSYFYLASTSNLIYGDAAIILEAESTSIANLTYGALVIEKANPKSGSSITLNVSNCLFSNNYIEQDKGIFEVNCSKTSFEYSYFLAHSEGDSITAHIHIEGCYWYLEPDAADFNYCVGLWLEGTNNHDIKANIIFSNCEVDIYALTATAYGSGLVGIHSDTTPTLARTSGSITMSGNVLKAYTEVDLTFREICILRQSASAGNPPVFCGSVLLSNNNVLAGADSSAYSVASILRGISVVYYAFNIYSLLGYVEELNILVKVVNCHQVGGISCFCAADIIDDGAVTYRINMVIDNVSHVTSSGAPVFYVRATTTVEKSVVSIRNVLNSTYCYLNSGVDGSLQVSGCMDTVFTVISNAGNIIQISGCTHNNCAQNFIALSGTSATVFLKISDLVIKFTSAAYYLAAAGAAITLQGGMLTDTLQYSGHASFQLNFTGLTATNNTRI